MELIEKLAPITAPTLVLLMLGLVCLWNAIRVSRQPKSYGPKPSIHDAIIGNTMGVKHTKDGKTVILTGRRPQTEPEPDGFIE